MRASSPPPATTHGAPTWWRRRYASPPRSRDPVGTPDDGVRARGVRGTRRGARARPTRLDPSGGCAEWPRARDRLRGVLARVRAPGREAVRQGHVASAQAVAVNKATRSIDEMDMDPEHVTFASSDEFDARCVRLLFSSRARASRAPRRRRERDASATRHAQRRGRHARRHRRPRRVGGERPRAFPRVVSREFSSPARQPQPCGPHVTRCRNRVAAPPGGADRTRRAARFPRPAHVTTRGSRPLADLSIRPRRVPLVPPFHRIHRRSPPLSHPRKSNPRVFALVAFMKPSRSIIRSSVIRSALRWTAPAACAVLTSTTSRFP